MALPLPPRDRGAALIAPRGRRLDWATLLRRVFLSEVLACACGGTLRVIASVEEGPTRGRSSGIRASATRCPCALCFRSHAFNVQVHHELPLEEIASVEPARSLGIIPKALLVYLRDGRRERFVVLGRSEWIRRLRELMATPSPS